MRLADLAPVTLLLPAIPLVVIAIMPAQPVEDQIQVIDQPREHRRMRPSSPPVECTPRAVSDVTTCNGWGTHSVCVRVQIDETCEPMLQPQPQIQF